MAKLQGLICLSACPQAREVMDAMQKDAHFSQIPVLKVDGGASNNNLLMQMQADALQVALCSSKQWADTRQPGSPAEAVMADSSLQSQH